MTREEITRKLKMVVMLLDKVQTSGESNIQYLLSSIQTIKECAGELEKLQKSES